MIPLVLITGFLGSGKTTLLRRLAEQARSRRLVCIVNEFGSVDVDGQLVELPPGQLVSIPGGSIFCTCLVSEFIRVLQQVADHLTGSLDADGAEPLVVVEASGIANPKVVARMLAETGLDKVFALRRIVTLVTPGSFLPLLETLPNIVAQVEACDFAIINKTDLYTLQQVDETHARIRELNPTVLIAQTQYCRIDMDLLADGELRTKHAPGGEYAACSDPNFFTRTIGLRHPVDRDKLLTELRSLQPIVYRAKGLVATFGGLVYVDVSAGGVSLEPAPQHLTSEQPVEGSGLVVIAAPAEQGAIDAFARRLLPPSSLNVLG